MDAVITPLSADGAHVLCANFPRTYIDVNRAFDDIDFSNTPHPWTGPFKLNPSERAQQGHGLIWTQAQDHKIYQGPLPDQPSILKRLDQYYMPYHAALNAALNAIEATHGIAIYLNMHSMPDSATGGLYDIVLGTRAGSTCSKKLTDCVADTCKAHHYRVAINQPYQGATLIKTYGTPDTGRHALQIEVSKSLYLDSTYTAIHPKGLTRLQILLRDILGQTVNVLPL